MRLMLVGSTFLVIENASFVGHGFAAVSCRLFPTSHIQCYYQNPRRNQMRRMLVDSTLFLIEHASFVGNRFAAVSCMDGHAEEVFVGTSAATTIFRISQKAALFLLANM